MPKKLQIALCDIVDSNKELEVMFINPYGTDSPDTSFTGTLLEIVREIDKRMIVYGTCEYYVVSKSSILLDMSRWEGDEDDDL